MTHSVTVVVCAYTLERLDALLASIGSVCRQDPPPREVLLVVDHNEELLQEMLTRLSSSTPLVRVIPSTGPKGLSGARNTGLSVAQGDVVAFLDDDAEAEPGWLRNLIAPYDDPHVVGVGGWVEPNWETERPTWFPDEFGWVVGCSYTGLPTDVARVRNPIGANMSFRREALDAVGGFSDGIGRNGNDLRGCEETEASIRVARLQPSSRILLAPDARVRHRVPAARTRWSYFRQRCYAEGQSKAMISQMVGSEKGLASERSYVRSTLPSGVAAAVRQAWRDRHPRHLSQAGAILGGLTATVAGYAREVIMIPLAKRRTT